MSCGSNIWRLVYESCGKDPIVDEVVYYDEQARFIIYNNLHDDNLKRLVGLKYAKEMWDNIESIFGDGTNNNMEDDKKRNKKENEKKGLKKNYAKTQQSHPRSANDSTSDEKE